MSAPLEILTKIKLLRNLTKSSNVNEAEAAKSMAEKLIAKYNVSEEDLSGIKEKDFYTDEQKLFVTTGIVGWKQQLSLAIAKNFDCQIIQEELVPLEGEHQFSYFVYGDNDQVRDVRIAFNAFTNRINDLILQKCMGKGPIYIDSYCEGVVEAVKYNIQMYGIEIPQVSRSSKKPTENIKQSNQAALATVKSDKDNPTDKKVSVNSQSIIKDIMAYFKGIDDGKYLSLEEVLELEVKNEEARRIQSSTEKAQEHSAQSGSTEASEGGKDSGS